MKSIRPKKLVVVIPALNEERTIGSVIAHIPQGIAGISKTEVVVIDDGSTDRTAELARAAGAVVLSHPKRLGVGTAFVTGIDAALRLQADVIVNIDGDGQFDPADIPLLIDPIVNAHYGFVTCTRFKDPTLVPDMPRLKQWGNRNMCRIINWIVGNGGFTDVSCGFRAYSRETALRLNLYGRFTYTQESFIDLTSKNIAMTEVPLRVRGVREFGDSRVAANVWRYALQTLPIIVRAMRDVRPLTFFGSIAVVFGFVGALLHAFVAVWWLATGHTSPWTSLITLGTTGLIMGMVTAVIALIADQLGRSRRIQEQLLYFERLRYYERFFGPDAPSGAPPALGAASGADASVANPPDRDPQHGRAESASHVAEHP